MATMALRNFHVPLSPEAYSALHREAKARGIPATVLVREAVEGWIGDQQAKRLRDEIAAYAADTAGTLADLDPELEEAAIATLRAAPGSD